MRMIPCKQAIILLSLMVTIPATGFTPPRRLNQLNLRLGARLNAGYELGKDIKVGTRK